MSEAAEKDKGDTQTQVISLHSHSTDLLLQTHASHKQEQKIGETLRKCLTLAFIPQPDRPEEGIILCCLYVRALDSSSVFHLNAQK